MHCGIQKLTRTIAAVSAMGMFLSLAAPLAQINLNFNRYLYPGNGSDNRQVSYNDGNFQPPPNYQNNNQAANQNGPDYQHANYYYEQRNAARNRNGQQQQQPTPAQSNNQNGATQTGYYQQQNGNRPTRSMQNDTSTDEMLMADASADETPVNRPIRSVVMPMRRSAGSYAPVADGRVHRRQ